MNKALELEVVRVAERHPNRIGPRRAFTSEDGYRCLVGEACFNLIGHGTPAWSVNARLWDVARNNDRGIPWGQIPKLVGLVPGEDPAEEVTAPETVEV
jgi:hypothetical protein